MAQHYFQPGCSPEQCCFIFPNKRSLLFFRKYVSDIAKERGEVLLCPSMLTVNDFFYSACGKWASDRVELLLELYKCYKKLSLERYGSVESLDEFIFWGDMILADFNDIDKYLVNAEGVLCNVAEFKALQDNSYLSEKQKAALEEFSRNFSGEEGKIKKEFRRIWDLLLPLYREFNACLDSLGKAYEGKVYRDFASRFDGQSAPDILSQAFPDKSKFIFIGLNALNECEKKVLRRMRNAGLAEFCWDYCSDWIKDPENKSSFFLKDNVIDFPQAFRPTYDSSYRPVINVLQVPSQVGQCKQIGRVLKAMGLNRPGMESAIVLPDESLLLPALQSIPEHIDHVNITMGYPLGGSQTADLMENIASLLLHQREKDGKMLYYYRQFRPILNNSLLQNCLREEEAEAVRLILKQNSHYQSAEELSFKDDSLLKAIFGAPKIDVKDNSASQISRIIAYGQNVLKCIGLKLREKNGDKLELDFAKEYYLCLAKIERYKLELLPLTFFKLLRNMSRGISVPFKGEPLKGLQIMGPLETRALDFENLIILSCNEGVFPKHRVSESFIPAELRKGFGLPTYEYQDSLWAYYFYRLIQRPKQIWLLLNTSAQGLQSCEESRFIKQLELHFKAEIRRWNSRFPLIKISGTKSLVKTPEHIEKLKQGKGLSASAIQTFIQCPARFYFKYVEGLEDEDEINENLDAGLIGTVFHETIQHLYSRFIGKDASRKELEDILQKEDIGKLVQDSIIKNLNGIEVKGRNLVFKKMIVKYVRKVIEQDILMLQFRQQESFKIVGLELMFKSEFEGFPFIGFIDRLDSLTAGSLRIVDYKTGKVEDDELNINDNNAIRIACECFAPKNYTTGWPKIAIQLFLYDKFAAELYPGKQLYNSIYQTSRLFTEPVEQVPVSKVFMERMEEHMKACLKDMQNCSFEWERTLDDNNCKYCDFKLICGK